MTKNKTVLDDFWSRIRDQLKRISTATTADAVIENLDPPSSGDAFFAGSGGDDQLSDALRRAGWQIEHVEYPYFYTATHPVSGDTITYIEGDVYRGDCSPKECANCGGDPDDDRHDSQNCWADAEAS